MAHVPYDQPIARRRVPSQGNGLGLAINTKANDACIPPRRHPQPRQQQQQQYAHHHQHQHYLPQRQQQQQQQLLHVGENNDDDDIPLGVLTSNSATYSPFGPPMTATGADTVTGPNTASHTQLPQVVGGRTPRPRRARQPRPQPWDNAAALPALVGGAGKLHHAYPMALATNYHLQQPYGYSPVTTAPLPNLNHHDQQHYYYSDRHSYASSETHSSDGEIPLATIHVSNSTDTDSALRSPSDVHLHRNFSDLSIPDASGALSEGFSDGNHSDSDPNIHMIANGPMPSSPSVGMSPACEAPALRKTISKGLFRRMPSITHQKQQQHHHQQDYGNVSEGQHINSSTSAWGTPNEETMPLSRLLKSRPSSPTYRADLARFDASEPLPDNFPRSYLSSEIQSPGPNSSGGFAADSDADSAHYRVLSKKTSLNFAGKSADGSLSSFTPIVTASATDNGVTSAGMGQAKHYYRSINHAKSMSQIRSVSKGGWDEEDTPLSLVQARLSHAPPRKHNTKCLPAAPPSESALCDATPTSWDHLVSQPRVAANTSAIDDGQHYEPVRKAEHQMDSMQTQDGLDQRSPSSPTHASATNTSSKKSLGRHRTIGHVPDTRLRGHSQTVGYHDTDSRSEASFNDTTLDTPIHLQRELPKIYPRNPGNHDQASCGNSQPQCDVGRSPGSSPSYLGKSAATGRRDSESTVDSTRDLHNWVSKAFASPIQLSVSSSKGTLLPRNHHHRVGPALDSVVTGNATNSNDEGCHDNVDASDFGGGVAEGAFREPGQHTNSEGGTSKAGLIRKQASRSLFSWHNSIEKNKHKGNCRSRAPSMVSSGSLSRRTSISSNASSVTNASAPMRAAGSRDGKDQGHDLRPLRLLSRQSTGRFKSSHKPQGSLALPAAAGAKTSEQSLTDTYVPKLQARPNEDNDDDDQYETIIDAISPEDYNDVDDLIADVDNFLKGIPGAAQRISRVIMRKQMSPTTDAASVQQGSKLEFLPTFTSSAQTQPQPPSSEDLSHGPAAGGGRPGVLIKTLSDSRSNSGLSAQSADQYMAQQQKLRATPKESKNSSKESSSSKNEKICIALEKLRIADLKKVSIRIYVTEANRYFTFYLSTFTTVDMLLSEMKEQGVLDPGFSDWRIYEIVGRFLVERVLHGWEIVTDIVTNWANTSGGHDEENAGNSPSKQRRLQNFLIAKRQLPAADITLVDPKSATREDLDLVICDTAIRDMVYYRLKKNKWRERLFDLEGLNILFAKDSSQRKGKSKLSHFVSLENHEIYTQFIADPSNNDPIGIALAESGSGSATTLAVLKGAPSRYMIGLKSELPVKVFEKPDEDYVKWLCFRTPEQHQKWFRALHGAKHRQRIQTALEEAEAERARNEPPRLPTPRRSMQNSDAESLASSSGARLKHKVSSLTSGSGKQAESSDFAATLISALENIEYNRERCDSRGSYAQPRKAPFLGNLSASDKKPPPSRRSESKRRFTAAPTPLLHGKTSYDNLKLPNAKKGHGASGYTTETAGDDGDGGSDIREHVKSARSRRRTLLHRRHKSTAESSGSASPFAPGSLLASVELNPPPPPPDPAEIDAMARRPKFTPDMFQKGSLLEQKAREKDRQKPSAGVVVWGLGGNTAVPASAAGTVGPAGITADSVTTKFTSGSLLDRKLSKGGEEGGPGKLLHRRASRPNLYVNIMNSPSSGGQYLGGSPASAPESRKGTSQRKTKSTQCSPTDTKFPTCQLPPVPQHPLVKLDGQFAANAGSLLARYQLRSNQPSGAQTPTLSGYSSAGSVASNATVRRHATTRR